jgi:ribosomal protein S17E
MRNIRPAYLKRIIKELININLDKFVSSDFQHNKKKVLELADFDSKVIQNRFAVLYYRNFSYSKNSKEGVW